MAALLGFGHLEPFGEILAKRIVALSKRPTVAECEEVMRNLAMARDQVARLRDALLREVPHGN